MKKQPALEVFDKVSAAYKHTLEVSAMCWHVSCRLQFTRDRPRAERIVLDCDISAGWMHAGYPIMVSHTLPAMPRLLVPGVRRGHQALGTAEC